MPFYLPVDLLRDELKAQLAIGARQACVWTQVEMCSTGRKYRAFHVF